MCVLAGLAIVAALSRGAWLAGACAAGALVAGWWQAGSRRAVWLLGAFLVCGGLASALTGVFRAGPEEFGPSVAARLRNVAEGPAAGRSGRPPGPSSGTGPCAAGARTPSGAPSG